MIIKAVKISFLRKAINSYNNLLKVHTILCPRPNNLVLTKLIIKNKDKSNILTLYKCNPSK